MAFGLALSFYRNILFEQKLLEIEEGNELIAQEIDDGYVDLEYFRSEQFKDKHGKENLGRMNPGEKVLIISTETEVESILPDMESAAQRERREAAYEELLRQMPIFQHWQLYLFRRDRLEEIRQML